MLLLRHLLLFLILSLTLSRVKCCMDFFDDEEEDEDSGETEDSGEDGDSGSGGDDDDDGDGNECGWGDTAGGAGTGNGCGPQSDETTTAEAPSSTTGGNECGWGDTDGNGGTGGCAGDETSSASSSGTGGSTESTTSGTGGTTGTTESGGTTGTGETTGTGSTASSATDSSDSTSSGSTGGSTDGTGSPSGDEDVEAECTAIVCDFEDESMCSYETLSADSLGGGSRRFRKRQRARALARVFFKAPSKSTAVIEAYEVYEGRSFNYVTGILSASEGSTKYAAVYLKQGSLAALSTKSEFLMTKTRVIRAKYYDATQGLTLSGCCRDGSTSSCTQMKKPGVVPEDRAWKTVQFKCPQGTTSVHFLCSNELGESQGACGLDEITLHEYDIDSFDPENPESSLADLCAK